jgi:hypothetical protein
LWFYVGQIATRVAIWPMNFAWKKLAPISLLLLLLAGLIFRWVDLRADPPFNFSNSGGDYLDGMANAHTARAYIQFGVWRGDDWDTYVYSPIHTLLQVLWFRLAGVSISSNNGFGAGMATLYLLALVGSVRRAAARTSKHAPGPCWPPSSVH